MYSDGKLEIPSGPMKIEDLLRYILDRQPHDILNDNVFIRTAAIAAMQAIIQRNGVRATAIGQDNPNSSWAVEEANSLLAAIKEYESK